MASYLELWELRADAGLRYRTTVAVVVKAQSLIDSVTPTAAEIAWADNALANATSTAQQILNYVLAVNKDSTVGNILGSSDTAIQTNVDTAVIALISGGA